jgi:tripartite-type tricarboxylate transporter receptor subunit TctC
LILKHLSLFITLIMAMAVAFYGAGCMTVGSPGQEELPEVSFTIDDLSGKTVKLIVPHAAGGGYDTYARLLAPYIEKHTGAIIVIDNVTGAAGVVGRNEIFEADPDGFTIGFTAYSSIIMNSINELEAARYRVDDFYYLGRVTGEPTVIAADANSGVADINDLIALEVVSFGEPSVVDDTYFNALVFGHDHGINILPVTGYEGTSELKLAILRGEFIILNRSLSNITDLIDSGELIPLVISGMERSDYLPNVPTMLELAATDEQRGHAHLFATMVENSRGFIAPPGAEPAIINTWQEILERVLTDPDLLVEADSRSLPINFMPGDAVSLLMAEAVILGEAIKPLIKELAKLAE